MWGLVLRGETADAVGCFKEIWINEEKISLKFCGYLMADFEENYGHLMDKCPFNSQPGSGQAGIGTFITAHSF